MTQLEPQKQRPEVRRVARLLGVAPEQVAYLDCVSDDDLQVFGSAVNNWIVELARAGSVNVGRLARAIPVSTAAKVAAKVDSPVMVARLAHFNDPQWARKMAEHLPAGLLAGAVAELDAETTADLVGGMSEELQVEVLAILVKRQEWIALGELFGCLPSDRVRSWAGKIGPAELAEIREMVPTNRREHVENAIV